MAGILLLGGGVWFFNNALFNGKAEPTAITTRSSRTDTPF